MNETDQKGKLRGAFKREKNVFKMKIQIIFDGKTKCEKMFETLIYIHKKIDARHFRSSSDCFYLLTIMT